MRIVSWNCCRGPLAQKLQALTSLQPDVAVICEAPAPPDASDDVLWFPADGSKFGVQVRAYGDYHLQGLPSADLPRCVNPLRVIGSVSFNMLAVWTWPAPTYLQALLNGIDAYANLINSGPTVIAGDFNGNPVYDKPRQLSQWGDAFMRINELGLVSAYHQFAKAPYGSEGQPTHHFLRKAERPFHIDYCFVPKEWCNSEFVASVPSGTPWNSLGDHFPVIVDVFPSPSTTVTRPDAVAQTN